MQGSSRKSCSLAGGFVPTRSHRGGRARRYLVVIRVLAFVSSGVMTSIKSIGRHIGHDSSVGVCIGKRSRKYRIESAIRHGQGHVRPVNGRWRAGRFSSGLCRYA